MTLVVAPDDADDWWRMELGPQPAVTTRWTGPVEAGDAEVAGPAVGLYLALWNRSDHSTDVRDASGVVDLWRHRSVVRWT